MRNKLSKCRVGWVAGVVGLFSCITPLVWANHSGDQELIFSPAQQVSTATGGDADELVMDSSGTRIIWVSDHLNGTPNIIYSALNEDGNGNTVLSSPVAVTPGQSADDISAHPRVNSDGTQLIFQSKGNFKDRNPGKVVQTYRADITNLPTIVEQLTSNQNSSYTLPSPDPTGHLSHASASGFGGSIAFSSSRVDFSPCHNCQATADSNNEEIFLYDGFDGAYYQVTFTGPGVHNIHPVIDDAGQRVVYISNLAGPANGDGSYEVFLVNVSIRETFESICDDGVDNDLDGLTDCGGGNPANMDPDCTDTCNEPQFEVCDNTVDDDADGLIDCADDDCAGDVACPLSNNSPSLALTDAADQPIAGALAINEGEQVTIKISASDDDVTEGEDEFGDIIDVKDKVVLHITSDTKAFSELRPKPTMRVVSGCDSSVGDVCACTLDSAAGCTLTGPVDATLAWKPDFTQGGQTYQFTVTADDANEAGGSAWENSSQAVSQSVTINVSDQNQPVKISPTTLKVTMKQGSTKTIEVIASDGDGNTIDFPSSGLLLPAWVSSEIRDQVGTSRKIVLTTAPTASDVGTQTIQVVATDGPTSATFTGTLEVILNRDPVINVPDRLTVNEGVALGITVKASDPDGDPALSYGIDHDADTPPEFAMPASSVYLLTTRVFYWHPQLDYVETNGGAAGGSVDKQIRFWANDGVATVYKVVTITVKDTDPSNAVCSSAACTGVITVPRGTTTTLSLTFTNTGTTTWTSGSGYALLRDVTTSTALVSPSSVPLASGVSVPPGGQTTFTVGVKAPTTAGTYYFRTRVGKDGKAIGTTAPTYTTLKVQ